MITEAKNTPLELVLTQTDKADLIKLIIEIEQINSANPKDARYQINQVILDSIPNYVFI
jgi:hypothetical protein